MIFFDIISYEFFFVWVNIFDEVLRVCIIVCCGDDFFSNFGGYFIEYYSILYDCFCCIMWYNYMVFVSEFIFYFLLKKRRFCKFFNKEYYFYF